MSGGVKHYGPVNGMLERLFEAGRASRAKRYSQVRLLRLEQGTVRVLDVRLLPGPALDENLDGNPDRAAVTAPSAEHTGGSLFAGQDRVNDPDPEAGTESPLQPNNALTSTILSGMAIPWGQRVSHTPQAVQAPARALSGNVM